MKKGDDEGRGKKREKKRQCWENSETMNENDVTKPIPRPPNRSGVYRRQLQQRNHYSSQSPRRIYHFPGKDE